METDVEAMLRLAWLVDREGRAGTRDALLTLAMSAPPADRPPFGLNDLAERCQSILAGRLPSYWFANDEKAALSLANPKVSRTLTNLHVMFPPVRVQRLLMRAEILRGPFQGADSPATILLRDLQLDSESVHDAPSLPFPGSKPAEVERQGEGEVDLLPLYWSILLVMAVILNVVTESGQSNRDQRAA